MSQKSVPELGRPLADIATPPTIYENFLDACAVKAAFLEHVRSTNEPETFPGLCHSKPPTTKARFLLIVDEFKVDPSKRPDGEFIRCAACATRKKFGRGSLAWYPAEGVLRVVGNECGNEQRAEARDEYKRRSTLSVLNEYLDAHLPALHGTLLRVEALRAAARHAQELSLQLKTQASSFCTDVLRAVKAGDGRLQIFASERDEGSRDERPVTIFKPSGIGFLKPNYQPLRRLDEALLRLEQADHGSPSKARRWLDSHRQKLGDLDACHANHTAGMAKVAEVEAMIAEALAFLAEANLDGIDQWSAAHSLRLRARWGLVYVSFMGAPKGIGKPYSTSLRPNWNLLESAGWVSPH